jgi:hypothetical protein
MIIVRMAETFDVFASYGSPDRVIVEDILLALRQQGVRPWFDKWCIKGGDRFIQQIAAALDEVPAIAVFIGSEPLRPWQSAEVERAIKQSVESDSKRVIPVLMPGADVDQLPPFLDILSAIRFPSATDAGSLRLLKLSIEGREPGPDPERIPFAGKRPYRGLDAFDVKDVQFFAGREGTIKQLNQTVNQILGTPSPKLFGIVGDSGSGKSSLARAGLIPELMSGAIERAPSWKYLIVDRPGASPVQSLAIAVAAANGTDPVTLRNNIKADKTCLGVATTAIAGPKDRLLLLIDQFEETFSLCPDEAERVQFVDALMHACSAPDCRTLVVLTLRADFYGACADGKFAEFGPSLNRQHLLLGSMTAAELQRAIREPAMRAGCEVEEGLVDLLVKDALDQRGSLPLLQFTLDELWRAKTGRRLTVESYRKLNGLSGALNKRADKLYRELDPQQQAIVNRILLRLVQIGDDGRLLRTRVPLQQILRGPADSPRTKAVQEVVDRLASWEYRLVTITASLSNDGPDQPAFIEVTHEAVIRDWKTLRDLIDDPKNHEFMLWRQQFVLLYRLWCDAKDDPGAQLRGSMLDKASRWLAQRPEDFSPEETQFIEISRASALEEERSQHRGRALKWGLGAAAAAASAAVLFLLMNPAKFDERIQKAASLLSANPPLSMAIALRALADHSDPETIALVEQALQASTEPTIEHSSEIVSVMLSADGQRVVAGDEDGAACTWTVAGQQVFCTPPLDGPVLAIAFTSGGAELRAITRSGKFVQWSAATGERLAEPRQTSRPVEAAACAAGGSCVIAGDGEACVWQPPSREPGPCYPAIRNALAVAMPATGNPVRFAVTGAGAEGVIVRPPADAARIVNPGGMVKSASFNVSGTLLLTSPQVGAAQLWEPTSGKPQGEPVLPGGQKVLSATLTNNGDFIVAANSDGSTALWNVQSRAADLFIPGSNTVVRAVAVDPKGSRAAVVLAEGRIRIYDFNPAELQARACREEKRLRKEQPHYFADCRRYIGAECDADCEKLPLRTPGR